MLALLFLHWRWERGCEVPGKTLRRKAIAALTKTGVLVETLTTVTFLVLRVPVASHFHYSSEILSCLRDTLKWACQPTHFWIQSSASFKFVVGKVAVHKMKETLYIPCSLSPTTVRGSTMKNVCIKKTHRQVARKHINRAVLYNKSGKS